MSVESSYSQPLLESVGAGIVRGVAGFTFEHPVNRIIATWQANKLKGIGVKNNRSTTFRWW